MAEKSEPVDRQTAIDQSMARLERLRNVLEDEVREGRDRIDELVADIEARLSDLRPGAEEVEEPATAVESIGDWMDDLAEAVEEDLDEGREAAASIVAELRERVDDLERSIRGR